ncbi:MAG: hypothetical protein ACOVQX_04860 [Legionella sp.]
MPSFNSLFWFLHYRQPKIIQAEIKASKTGARYAILPLAINLRELIISGNDYQLSGHHLTIFENYKNFDLHSSYHYTAELTDKSGLRFRLHIYFDQYDKPIGVSKLTPEEESASISLPMGMSTHEQKLLTDMAIMFISLPMARIRHEQKIYISTLDARITKEINVLFALSHDDLRSLIKATALQLEIARELQYIGGRADFFRMLQKFQESLEWAEADLYNASHPVASPSPLQPKVAEASQDEEDKLAYGNIDQESRPSPIKQHQFAEDFEKLIVDLEVSKTKISTLGFSLDQVLDYNHRASDALAMLMDSKDFKLVSGKMRVVNEHLYNSQKLCQARFDKALLVDDWVELEKLSQTSVELADNQLSLAIAQNKIKRLEWLLSKGHYSLNNMRITCNDQSIHLLQYAVNKNRPECFKLLLTYGASAMILAEDSLPLAHHILQQRIGPFVDALNEHMIFQGYKGYMRQLIRVLNVCVAQSPESTLKTAIDRYERTVHLVPNLSVGRMANAMQHGQQFFQAVEENTNSEVIQAILNLPEFRAKSHEYELADNEYRSKLSPNQLVKAMREHRLMQKSLVDYLKMMGNSSLDQDKALAELDRLIALRKLCSRQHDVAAELSKYNNQVRKKIPKNVKLLLKENQELMKEINSLNMSSDNVQSVADLLSGLNSMSNSLNDCEKMFKEVTSDLQQCLDSTELKSCSALSELMLQLSAVESSGFFNNEEKSTISTEDNLPVGSNSLFLPG